MTEYRDILEQVNRFNDEELHDFVMTFVFRMLRLGAYLGFVAGVFLGGLAEFLIIK